MSVNMSYREFDQSLDMVFNWLLAEFSDFIYWIELGSLIVLFQLNQRYRDLRPILASLHPCGTLSALMFAPISFRVPQEDRCR